MGEGQTPVSAPVSSEGRRVDALGWRIPDARNPQRITAHHSKQTFRHHSALKGSNIGGDTSGGVKRERSSPLYEVNFS